MNDTDIVISGGGIAGLVAAAAFGSAGFSVICIDPAPPVTDGNAPGADLRSTAFLQPALDLLRNAGVSLSGAALRTMRLVDAGGPSGEVRLGRDFEAADISNRPFGENFPNWQLRYALMAQIGDLSHVSFRPGVGFLSVVTRDDRALVRLTDGTRIAARLLIAADGRDSPVRHAFGIGARRIRYGQKALAFAVTHPVPHGNVSTEIHRSGGPFTLVPLPDHRGLPASSVVWMETGPECLRLKALPPPAFEAAMSERSAFAVGPLTLATERSVWPIVSQIADRIVAPRTALVAEAAHVMPPIGAQGLNTSLADIACLLDLARTGILGSPAMLDAYARTRLPRIRARMAGIDLLNRAAMAREAPMTDLRAAGLAALHGVAPLRRALMRAGTGLTGAS